MGDFTDADGNPIDLDELFADQRIVCSNKHNPETCGEDCDIVVSGMELARYGWTKIALAENWEVVMHRCLEPDHPIHALAFCSLACLGQWAAEQQAQPHVLATSEEDAALRARILEEN